MAVSARVANPGKSKKSQPRFARNKRSKMGETIHPRPGVAPGSGVFGLTLEPVTAAERT
jgi:hypothetical protein